MHDMKKNVVLKDQYIPPLAINFIWHPSDSEVVSPILSVIKNSFSRDKLKPFSRGLNTPLFFFSTYHKKRPPSNQPQALAKANVIFVFTSTNTVGHTKWKNYIENLLLTDEIYIVPVAVDSYGYTHDGTLKNLNCIRISDWPFDNRDYFALISMAHEVFRFSRTPVMNESKGINISIKIFLSHSKIDDIGKENSEKIKRFIDNSNMNCFFDANEISPGFRFDKEIEAHIRDSTLLAIESDTYSSRYWCQHEILIAKSNDRPIIVVNCLDNYEDRIFPAASNVPCIHIPSATPISEKDVLRVLSTAIIETIRFNHSMRCLEAYKSSGWIDSECTLSARPPEIRQVIDSKKEGVNKICYPEPPIYSIEADWHKDLGIQAFTPLWHPSDLDCLANKRIGISISYVPSQEFMSLHLSEDSLNHFAQDIARHLLARSATLIYGGDLRQDGFTQFILDEAAILKERLNETKPHVENHLAWPLYLSDKENLAWRAKYHQVMETVEHIIPEDAMPEVDTERFLPPINFQNSYIWSRCLSEMRQKSVKSSSARICAGGKVAGYKGKMPGVLEEMILSLEAGKPVFLLGAFGGITGDICSLLLTGKVPETLTEDWQIKHNAGYSQLQRLAGSHGHHCDYEKITDTMSQLGIQELAVQCGLDIQDYKRLMISPFVDECVYLIIKGLKARRI